MAGLPWSRRLRGSALAAAHLRSPSGRGDDLCLVHALYACVRDDHRRLYDLPLHFVCAAYCFRRLDYGRTWTAIGPWDWALVSATGCGERRWLRRFDLIGMQPPHEQSAWVVGGTTVALLATWFGFRATISTVHPELHPTHKLLSPQSLTDDHSLPLVKSGYSAGGPRV